MTPIKFEPIDEPEIDAIGYSEAEEKLYVRFRGASEITVYLDVPPGAWRLMRASESKAKFLAKCIAPRHLVEKVAVEGSVA